MKEIFCCQCRFCQGHGNYITGYKIHHMTDKNVQGEIQYENCTFCKGTGAGNLHKITKITVFSLEL